MNTGVVKPHINKGNCMAIKENDPQMPPLRGSFGEFLNGGEVQATKFIQKLIDGRKGHATRDDDDGNVYLPSTSKTCPCY